MADRLTLSSPAKLNLSLSVMGRRPDGYHDIETVFQTISVADTVSVELAGEGIEVTADDPGLPEGESNLAGRAARRLLEATSARVSGIRIRLRKRVPVGAGLGGGSGDAATVLVALNRLLLLGLTADKLEEIGAEVGSDVPFLVRGGTAIGRGRGERLERLPPLERVDFLLAKPSISISTTWAYRELAGSLTASTPRPIVDAIGADRTLFGLLHEPWNAFDGVVMRRHPEVREIRDLMLAGGALSALMTGSGPTVFGVFEDRQKLRDAESSLRSLSNWSARAEPVTERDVAAS